MPSTTQSTRTGIPALDLWADFWRDQLPFWAQADDFARVWVAMARPTLGWFAPFTGTPAAPSPVKRVEYPKGRTMPELEVGQTASFTKVITQEDIDAFAHVSGDVNPVHLDAEFAEGTIFKGRIAHGILTSGLISAAIGLELPGMGTIYLSQSLRWLKPVLPGDELTATVTVKELIPEKNRAVLDTVVTRGEDVVLTGEALVMPPPA